MHPFSRARERTRALNAAKMDRMFAKPFVGALEGHVDAVEVLAKQGDSISTVASGSWDGGVCVNLHSFKEPETDSTTTTCRHYSAQSFPKDPNGTATAGT